MGNLRINMEKIINKAIEGGYSFEKEKEELLTHGGVWHPKQIVLDPLFWQALGKACGWDKQYAEKYNIKTDRYYIGNAMEFHHINLTEGWDKAVAYLQELVK